MGRLVRLAAIVAVAVAAGRLIISLVRDLVAGGSLDLLSTLATNAIGVIGTTATLLAIGAVVLFGAKKSIVVRGAVVVYVAHLIDGFLSSFVRGLLSGYRPGVGFNTLVNPLSSVLFFLGVVATIRLYQGKTALPGVDIRI